MMKIAIFLAFSVASGLLCIADAAPEQKRDVASMKDLIREIKADSVSTQVQNDDESGDETDKVLAQLFTEVLEKQAKAERYEDSDKLAQSEGFFDFSRRVWSFLRRAVRKLHYIRKKMRRVFHRKTKG